VAAGPDRASVLKDFNPDSLGAGELYTVLKARLPQ